MNKSADSRNTVSRDESRKIRVACLGDSTTWGHGVENREQDHYPAQLERILGRSFQIFNCGKSGHCLMKKAEFSYWRNGLEEALALMPQIVVSGLGINDTQPHVWIHKADFKKDYIDMISLFKELNTKPRLYLFLPVPWLCDSGYAGRDELHAYIREVAEETDSGIIDIYTPLNEDHTLIPDGLHPNARGANVIARVVAEAIQRAGKI